MATARTRWLRWSVLLGALLAIGVVLWYAHMQGWLDPAYAWVGNLTSVEETEKPDDAGMEDMPGMPGMKMPKRQEMAETASTPPGYAQVMVAPELQQRIGVKLGEVKEETLRMNVRAVGIVQPDETKVTRVHLKTEGWVEELFIDFTGQKVDKGDRLLAIYSPEFLTTQREYLSTRKAQPALAESSQRRLELWGVSAEEIEQLKKTGEAQRSLVLRSPQTGTVLEKNAFEGQRVTPADELYVVADLSTVWVQAKVYEYELPHVALGQLATVTLPALPERELSGKVVFIQPTLEEATRTVQVRVELPNDDELLKPGMFAHVNIAHEMGKGLLVPTSAVIRTGERDIVFRVEKADMKDHTKTNGAKMQGMQQMDHAEMDHAMMADAKMKDAKRGGLFVPVEVTVSPVKFGDQFHVLNGLQAGDNVVTSANFLIDSESRLRFGGGGMAGMPGMEMGGMKME